MVLLIGGPGQAPPTSGQASAFSARKATQASRLLTHPGGIQKEENYDPAVCGLQTQARHYSGATGPWPLGDKRGAHSWDP